MLLQRLSRRATKNVSIGAVNDRKIHEWILTNVLEIGMKINVDRARCTGHAMCFAQAPELFPLDDEGFSIADGTIVPPGQEERAQRGVDACPERAIHLSNS